MCKVLSGRGALNFGDERLYVAVLEDYSERLLHTVQRIEREADEKRLRDEVALIRSSAACPVGPVLPCFAWIF